MNGRRSSRRNFLGALLGSVALLGAGRRNGALADKNLNHQTKENFQSSCEQYGGGLHRLPARQADRLFLS